jgi:quinol-cytochrome oxidoreductase complex cytochrome b subunit
LKKPGALILKKDNLKLGILLGLLLPFFVAVFLYFLKFSHYSVSEFLETASEESRLITFFAAWCMVANIGLFTLYINTNKYETSKGIFIITIVYGVLFLLLKLLS